MGCFLSNNNCNDSGCNWIIWIIIILIVLCCCCGGSNGCGCD